MYSSGQDVSVQNYAAQDPDIDVDQEDSHDNEDSANGLYDEDSLDQKPGKEKKRRAFKACAHCRQRKAKCDLGDLNNPHDPPCSRCLREGISCVFLPSRRGGRVPFAARKANSIAPDSDNSTSAQPPTGTPRSTTKSSEKKTWPPKNNSVAGSSTQSTDVNPPPLRTFSFPSILNIDPQLTSTTKPPADLGFGGISPQLSSSTQQAQAYAQPNNVGQSSDKFDSITSKPFATSAKAEASSAMMPWHASPQVRNKDQSGNASTSQMHQNAQQNQTLSLSATQRSAPLPSLGSGNSDFQDQANYESVSAMFADLQSTPFASAANGSTSGQSFVQMPPAFPQQSPFQNHMTGQQPYSPLHKSQSFGMNTGSTGQPPQRMQTGPASLSNVYHVPTPPLAASAVPGSMSTSIVSPSGDSAASLDSANRRLKHRAGEDARPVDPDELASAKLRNPVDALNLLVLAADAGKDKGQAGTSPEGHGDGDATMSRPSDDQHDGKGLRRGSASPSPAPPFTLADFALVKRGVISTLELIYFVNLFFAKIHHIFPMVPQHRIPTTEAELTAFARDEVHLTTVFILIASRADQGGQRQLQIHEKTWVYMRELINDLVFGKDPTVGAVEALLLLSENPPRELAGAGSHKDDYAEENRMSWMIVGTAVRIGYMLALDQTSIYPAMPNLPNTPEGKAMMEKQDRERIAWTYCYLFDRQVSIRTGKAFWSRGPGLCFTEYGTTTFPSMRAIPGVQDDFASLISAYVEVTQVMSNAHDILYPSKDRTIALVRVGEYTKYIDEFTRTLNVFRFTWEGKKWEIFPLTECVWITFHYVRLYIYAFAFQAHLQRVTDDASGSSHAVPAKVLFPRGPMGSPDAKFILEAIDAAADLLRICVDRLHPQGVLQYLPWRFYLFFAYAGVFLLKAVFINAVTPSDRRTVVRLLKRLIVCLACASKDEHHHAVRYARLLNSLLKTFSRGRDGVGTGTYTPFKRSAVSSPAPGGDDNWPVSRATSPVANEPKRQKQSQQSKAVRAQPEATSAKADVDNSIFLGAGLSGINAAQPQQASNNFNSFLNFAPVQQDQYSNATSQLASDAFTGSTAQEERTAADLLADFDFDIGLPPTEATNIPLDAYNNLLDDTTLSFWAALSNNQGDWNSNNILGS